MSGHRLWLTLVGAAVAALMVAAPALAGDRAPARMRTGVFSPQTPRAFSLERPLRTEVPRPPAKDRDDVHAVVGAGHRVHGRYGIGIYPTWDPYWYGYPGWGWGYPGWGWYGPPLEDHVTALEPAVPKDRSLVALRVHPSRAEVVVDGVDRGRSRAYDTVRQPLWLDPGDHVIELRTKGYQELTLDLHLEGGHAYTLRYDLKKGVGMDERSS